MSDANDEDGGGRRGYHHGNLREALMKAALDLITEKGPSGFTFAEAARAAGVSPAAPYRHYRDRDALLADVARRGFEQLETRLQAARAKGGANPARALDALARSYLEFARQEPAQFSAMYESGLALASYPEMRDASARVFDVVREACAAVIEVMPEAKRPPAMMMALHVWSLVHGMAALLGRGDGGRRPIPMNIDDLVDAALLIYLAGVGGETNDG